MKRVILTIAIVLCAASAFADDHRDKKGKYDNRHYNGQYSKHDSQRGHECRDQRDWRPRHVEYRPEYRDWRPRHVEYRPEYREVRELPVRHVTYRPEYRYELPRVAVSIPSFPLSLFVAFR